MTSTGRVRRSRRGSGGADGDCFSRPQRAVTATEPAAKRIVGPRRAVVAGQGDQVRATGRYLIQDMGDIPLADRVPWRVRVAQYRLRHQRRPGRVHRQVQSADHGADRDVENLLGDAKHSFDRRCPQPLINTSPKPRTLTTRACSVT